MTLASIAELVAASRPQVFTLLERATEKITTSPHVTHVYVRGSLAAGRADRMSDLDFVAGVAKLALESKDLPDLMARTLPADGKSVADKLTNLIATIGENMSLRRMAAVSVGTGTVAAYVHNALAPGLGKIGVLVGLESSGDKAKLAALGKQLAMHVAAANPQALTAEAVDAAAVERERDILAEKAKASGKPDKVALRTRLVEGLPSPPPDR